MATLERTTGSSALYDVLHADHERLSRAVADLLATRDDARLGRRWKRLAVELCLHVRAAQEVIDERLEATQPERTAAARDEQAHIEQLLADADAAWPGTDFFDMVTVLGELVRHHADDLEGLLPDASVGAREQEELVRRFEDHKSAARTAVEMEFGLGGVDVQWAEDVEEEREVGRPSQARSAKGGGDVTSDLSTVGARHERKARRTPEAPAPYLEGRTVTELYDLAKARGLEVVRGMGKDELLEVLARPEPRV